MSDKFRGKTKQGLYGDVVTEIDWSVGQIMAALKRQNLDHNTLLMFSSDHGPWFLGDPGRLRGRKWQTYEGGFRVPFYARFPGVIPAGQVYDGFMSSMDILPTVAKLTGAALPEKPLDGIDAWPMLISSDRSRKPSCISTKARNSIPSSSATKRNCCGTALWSSCLCC